MRACKKGRCYFLPDGASKCALGDATDLLCFVGTRFCRWGFCTLKSQLMRMSSAVVLLCRSRFVRSMLPPPFPQRANMDFRDFAISRFCDFVIS